MTVVVIPWRDGDPERARALSLIGRLYSEVHPEWPIVLGPCSAEGPFNRSEAMINGVQMAAELHGELADVVAVVDGDSWAPDLLSAVRVVERSFRADVAEMDRSYWAIPFDQIYRLSEESTARVYAGHVDLRDPDQWTGLPLAPDATTKGPRPYRGNQAETITVFRRDVFEAVPPDPRMVGWGHEGEAHSAALETLVGPPWRSRAPLVHLHHPAQPRMSRRRGSRENVALLSRYNDARGYPDRMRAIIEEWRAPVG